MLSSYVIFIFQRPPVLRASHSRQDVADDRVKMYKVSWTDRKRVVAETKDIPWKSGKHILQPRNFDRKKSSTKLLLSWTRTVISFNRKKERKSIVNKKCKWSFILWNQKIIINLVNIGEKLYKFSLVNIYLMIISREYYVNFCIDVIM